MIKRPLYVLSNKIRRPRHPVDRMKEMWIADFSKPAKSCFDIKPEISYNAYLEKGVLFLGLKKKNCMAWLETVHRVYVDQIITARFRFDSHGGYCAAGIMFRVTGQETYYLALVSSKGYFRLDAVNNNIPQPLIGWTETPGLNGNDINLVIIAQGGHFIFLLNGKWIAEAHDASIPGGHFGFAIVSYDEELPVFSPEMPPPVIKEGCVCRSWLNSLSVDSRTDHVDTEYKKWNDCIEISAESRRRLAESLAALNSSEAAYNQILKIWKQREAAARSVTATYTEVRAREELIFAARMTSRLGRYTTAEEYINAALAMGVSGAEELNVLAEKAKILSAQNKYEDLAALLPDYIKKYADISALYALLGHAYQNLKKYKAAAAAWDKAFSLDTHNGLYAANAANAFEQLGKKSEALRRYVYGAQCFLRQEDYTELGTLVPRLLALGKKNGEAHALAGKWAAGIGGHSRAEPEFALADNPGRAARVNVEKTDKSVQKPDGRTRAKPGAVTAKKTAVKPKTKISAPAKKPKVKTKAKTGKTKK